MKQKNNQLDFRFHYRRRLPHYQPVASTFFMTYRLVNSIPRVILAEMEAEAEVARRAIRNKGPEQGKQKKLSRAQKEYFAHFDHVLDNASNGPFWLGQPEVAQIVANGLHFLDGEAYDLDAFCIMPNHVHSVFTPRQGANGQPYPLQKIMHSLKRHSALEANRVLKRQGAFWQSESYDYSVRNQLEWERIVAYVLNNPVKAGLAESWKDWPWSYLRDWDE